MRRNWTARGNCQIMAERLQVRDDTIIGKPVQFGYCPRNGEAELMALPSPETGLQVTVNRTRITGGNSHSVTR